MAHSGRLRIIGSASTLDALRKDAEFGPLFTNDHASGDESGPILLRAALDGDDDAVDDLVPGNDAGDIGRWRANLSEGISCGVVVHRAACDADLDRLVRWAERVHRFGCEELQEDRRKDAQWDVVLVLTAELGSLASKTISKLRALDLLQGMARVPENAFLFSDFYLMTPKLRDAAGGTPLQAKDLGPRQIARLIAHLHLQARRSGENPLSGCEIRAWGTSVLPLKISAEGSLRRAVEEVLSPFAGKAIDAPGERVDGASTTSPPVGRGPELPVTPVAQLKDFAHATPSYFRRQVNEQLGPISGTGAIDWRERHRKRALDWGRELSKAAIEDDRGQGSSDRERAVWERVKQCPSCLWEEWVEADTADLKLRMEGATRAIHEMLEQDRQLDQKWAGLVPKVEEQDRARASFVDLRWRLLAGFAVASLLGTVTTTVLASAGVEQPIALVGGSASGLVALATGVASYFLERRAGDDGVSELNRGFERFSSEVDGRIVHRRRMIDDGRRIVATTRELSGMYSTKSLKERLRTIIDRTYATCMDGLAHEGLSDPAHASEAIEIDVAPHEDTLKEQREKTQDDWKSFAAMEDSEGTGRYRVPMVVRHVERRFAEVLRKFSRDAVRGGNDKDIKNWIEGQRTNYENGDLHALSVQTAAHTGRKHDREPTVWRSELVTRDGGDKQDPLIPAVASRVAVLFVYHIAVEWDDSAKAWLEVPSPEQP